MDSFETECPHCGHVQEPNSTVGDLDVCNRCDKTYRQFVNPAE